MLVVDAERVGSMVNLAGHTAALTSHPTEWGGQSVIMTTTNQGWEMATAQVLQETAVCFRGWPYGCLDVTSD